MFVRIARFSALVLALAAPVRAAVVVNPPAPLTHVVAVQPIVTRAASGESATFLGDAAQEAYIKSQVNAIWAQAGIRVDWLAPVDYENGFVFDGRPTNYVTVARPTGDMALIDDLTGSPPKHASPVVLNMYFVRIVPAFALGDAYRANGYAWIDYNGITVYIGGGLPTFTAGQDIVASIIAHEIGHNLGLPHTAAGTPNLMSLSRTADYLTAAQKSLVFSNQSWIDGYDFVRPLPPPSPYQQWAAAIGVAGGPTDDDDRDGVANVIEFMLMMKGSAPDALPDPVASPAGVTWTLPKHAPALAEGLVYAVEVSPNGRDWLAAGSPGSSSSILADDASRLSVRLHAGARLALMRFTADLPASLVDGLLDPPLALDAGIADADGASAVGPPPVGCACAHP